MKFLLLCYTILFGVLLYHIVKQLRMSDLPRDKPRNTTDYRKRWEP